MSKHSEQMKRLVRSPRAMMDFQATGKMPQAVQPQSPLISYLESLSPRDRLQMKDVRLARSLGYQSGARFQNAQQMLNYLKPNEWMTQSWPAETVRIKAFKTKITDELFNLAQV